MPAKTISFPCPHCDAEQSVCVPAAREKSRLVPFSPAVAELMRSVGATPRQQVYDIRSVCGSCGQRFSVRFPI
jgi:transcription elongation factor Elf1